MRIVFFLIFLSILQFSQAANACFDAVGLSQQSLDEAKSEAYAIGVFEAKWAGDGKRAVIYKVVTRYTDFPSRNIRVELPRDLSMCDPPFPADGIYELVILKKGGEFFLSQKALKDEDWKILREGRDHGLIYKSKMLYCNLTKGVWETEGADYPKYICNYYASDSHKICRDSNECEGECLAFLAGKKVTDDTINISEQKRIADIQSHSEEFGRCSPLRKKNYCRRIIEDGKYVKDNCVKANKERN